MMRLLGFFSKRREALVPLLAAYFSFTVLYAWQASERLTPTLFSDEIEFTQISRSIAETGHAALRGGDPAPGASLYQWLVAPLWWIDDVGTAYSAIKYLGVLLMTATIFPAYALARLVVSRPYALFAAIGAVAAPALSYSPFLVEEPLAYPASTLALYLIARASLSPTRWTLGLAFLACAAGALVRAQLAILFVVLGLALLARAWRTRRAQTWRAGWTSGDWVGFVTLLVGAALISSAVIGHRSNTWYSTTGFLKQRLFEYGSWALGALAIGIGIVPLVAGLVALVRRRADRDEPFNTFASLTVAALAAFVFYTAVKATYLSITFSVVIAERNLIYLVPLLFTGTAIVLERRRPLLLPIALATILAIYLIDATPNAVAQYPNYEAHGLSIAAFGNRILRWPAERIETTLILVALASGLVLVAIQRVRDRRVAAAITAVVAVFALSWSLTAEIYAANGERIASDRQYAVMPTPPSWVDNLTGGEPTLFVGQGLTDPNPIWELEFWNRSIRWLWGMDGSAPGPGARATPNLVHVDGTHDPVEIGAEYVVAVNGVAINAPKVATVGGADLYKVGGEPVRLRNTTTGISPDGWMGKQASYTRYDADGRSGFVTIRFSRVGACAPDKLKPVRVTARVGPVVVDENDQPAIGKVTDRAEGILSPCVIEGLLLRVPNQSWRVEATVEDTFVPAEIDPNSGDRRELGAVVSFEVSKRDTSPEG